MTIIHHTVNRGGPPKLYVAQDVDPAVEQMAREGLTNDQIASELGIHRRTLYTWLPQYESLAMALQRGRADIDQTVVLSLLKRSLGFEVDEEQTTTEDKLDKEGNVHTLTKTVKTKRFIPPSDSAIIFFLKNRLPNEFRDRRELDITNDQPKVTLFNLLANLTVDDVKKAIDQGGVQDLLSATNPGPGSPEADDDSGGDVPG